MGIRFLTFFGILFCFISCNDSKESEKAYLNRLRSLNVDYFYLWGKPEEALKYRDSIKIVYADDPYKDDLYFLNDFLYQFASNFNNKEILFQKIDSTIASPDFQTAIPANRFYVYYSASRKLAQISLPDEAFDYGALALDQIERDLEIYYYERDEIKNLIFLSMSRYLDLEDLELHDLMDSYNKSIKLGPEGKSKALEATYYLSYHFYSFKKDYETAIKWADVAFETEPDYNNNPYLGELIMLKGLSLKELNRKSEVRQLYYNLNSQYNQGIITKEKWKEIQTFYAGVLVDVEPNDKVITIIDDLINQYGLNCEYRYQLLQLLPPLAKLYKNEGNKEKELETLQNTLTYSTRCNDFNEVYIVEERRVLERMFVLQLELGNGKESQAVMNEITEIEKQSEKNNEVFVKMDNYFSKNQSTYLSNLENLEQANESASERQKIAYILIAVILIISILFISSLVRKNKKIQKVLEAKNEVLNENNHKIDLQNQELVELISTLEESNENLQKFAKMAAEDIQSPIKQITQDVEEISRKYRQILKEDDQEILDFLKESTEQLIEMIETLLQYARNDQDFVADEEVDIEEVMESIKNKLLDEIIKRKATINYPDNIPKVYANRAMVSQLFQNLIANALKFGDPNRPLVIDVSFERVSPDSIQIAVHDNGVGIKKEDQSEIFKVFKKVESVEDYQGSGIGLSTCKKVVEKFGGKLWVESEWGKGSTFYFTLPTVKPSKTVKKDALVEKV